MFIGHISTFQNKISSMPKQSDLSQIAVRIREQKTQTHTDIVKIRSFAESEEQPDETGIYGARRGNMHSLFPDGVTYTQMEPDERLAAELLPQSEKGSYTEQDALMAQYLKQYRIEGRFEGDSFTLTSDGPVRLILPDMVSDEELENFRQGLVQNGMEKEIDWKGVENDFGQMGVGFDNADRLEMKADYIASRYAVLKDRIQTQYTGDEQTKQMDTLERIYNNAKNEMADAYAKEIGGFYEDLGQDVADDMKASVHALVDKKTSAYETHLSAAGDYAKISNPEDQWLLRDDAFMASQLRESLASSGVDTEEHPVQGIFSADDLTFAGVYAKTFNSQLKEAGERWYNEKDDTHLGTSLAAQMQDMLAACSDAGISSRMSDMLDSAFKPFMDKLMDRLDTRIDQQKNTVAKKPWMGGMVRTSYIDRSSVYLAFQKAMANY